MQARAKGIGAGAMQARARGIGVGAMQARARGIGAGAWTKIEVRFAGPGQMSFFWLGPGPTCR